MMKSFFSIIVFFLLKYFINCVDTCQTNCLKSDNKCVDIDSYHSCPSNCKPNFLSSDSNGCFTCDGSLDSSKCYYFTNGGCEISTIEQAISKGYKIVINSQCVSSCGENLYQMGDFCYENCIGGNSRSKKRKKDKEKKISKKRKK